MNDTFIIHSIIFLYVFKTGTDVQFKENAKETFLKV